MTLAASLALPVMQDLCFSGAEAAGIALSESSRCEESPSCSNPGPPRFMSSS
jgi:hypothetical protein